jgi:hypothetical protein
VGYALGGQWGVVERYLRPVSYAVAALVVVAAAWWLGKRWLDQRGGSGRHEHAARSTGDAGDTGDVSSAGRPRDGRTAAPRR